MKTILASVSLAALFILGCAGHSTTNPTLPSESAPTPQGATGFPAIDISTLPQVQSASGMTEGVLGIYWLVRDANDPLTLHLEPNRSAMAAQGDVYGLSVRPYMNPDSLTLLSSGAAPDNMTDYSFRFTHPFGLPADFEPPATASKRLDLFIFDVQVVVAIKGGDVFFGGTTKTNLTDTGTMNGYRQIGPLVDLSQMGITDGTNVFPYRLLHRIDSANPVGNYGTDGWVGGEYLSATGYDVIPQGASADATVRLANSIVNPLPVIILAKYMDPRGGATVIEKRANRLPTADPALLRYYLPEAAGDLQSITAQVAGELKDNNADDTATITLSVLDWDNAATVSSGFPNASNLNAISENSKPTQIEASFPLLRANGNFPASSVGAGHGLASEFVDITIPVTNIDQSFQAPPEGAFVNGLIRIRDQQDSTNPLPVLLDENLVPQPGPAGFEPSTRYQKAVVKVNTGHLPPHITAVDPTTALAGEAQQFTATNDGGDATSWIWGFGGGATPNTSTDESPTVQLGAPGVYTCLVKATNDTAEHTFYFDLTIEVNSPDITDVTLSTNFALRDCTFTPVNDGSAANSWLWNFGGGATPNTSTAQNPVVKLAKPGTYNGSVTAGNLGGDMTYNFQFDTTTKKIGLRLQVITSGTTYPKKLFGMSAWDLPGVQAWVQTRVNGPFRDAGIEIDLNQISLVPVNNPTLFNIDTNGEVNSLWNLTLGQNPDKLNAVVINAVPSSPGLGGVMTDTNCNNNNAGRGCWIIAWGADFDIVVLPHELGHVMNLPHVRTSSPINANNYNLMSYGTLSTALFESAPREEAASCITFSGAAPFNQFQVSNNWVHTYM